MAQVKRYHTDQPDWRRTTHRKTGDLIGVELEVYHEYGKQEAADALDNFGYGAEYPRPLAEDDSSLDGDYGVEIICPPLPVDEVVKKDGYICTLMSVLEQAGTRKEPGEGYGMHVNVNMHDWSDEEKLAVQYLLNRFYNIGVLLGKRSTGFGEYTSIFKLTRANSGMVCISTWPGGKHSAAHIRRGTTESRPGGADGTVIEVRLAKSSLDIENLKVIIDYVYALRNWVRVAPKHTIACCFLDYALSKEPGMSRSFRDAGIDSEMEKMFTHWCKKQAPGLYTLLKAGNIQQLAPKPNRLLVMQALTKGRNLKDALHRMGVHDDQSLSSPEQAVRISTIVGKSTGLQGEFATNGLIYASTLRPLN